MIDHVSVPVSDLSKAAAFYDHVLAPLAMRRVADRGRSIGFGKTYPELWLNFRNGMKQQTGNGYHVCLRAPSQAAVEAFHTAALEHGGRSEQQPASYPGVVTNYFCAFVLDLDGNKIEAATFPRT